MNRWFQAAGASSELLSIDRFLDSQVFATQSGAYGGTFRLNGKDPECLSDAELAHVSARLVQAMRLLPEHCSLYQVLVKRRGCDLLLSRYAEAADEMVAETQRKRHAYLATRPLGTVELYWTVCSHPPKSRKPPKPAEYGASMERLLRELRNTLMTLEQNLADLVGLERLDSQAQQLIYVAASRGREDMQVFVNARDELVENLLRREEKATALAPEEVGTYRAMAGRSLAL